MIARPIATLAVVASVAFFAGCSPPKPVLSADTIYTGGDIVTVNDAQPSVEVLAVKDGKILALGTRADIEKSHKGAATVVTDLGGKTLVPGFVDGHSHFMGTQDLDGLVMETGYLLAYANLPIPDESNEMEAAKAGQQLYAAAGITTAQEGATHLNQIEQLQRIAAKGGFYIDVVSFAFMTDLGKILAKNPPANLGTYNNRLKLGGCKIVSDGSPQGKTAFFTTPYLTGGPAGQKDWKREPNAPQADITALVKTCYDNNLPLLFHANGDAAIDSLLTAHEEVAKGSLDKDRRTTGIHAQFVRPDQITKFKQYNFIPSLFTDHAFFFGDTHVLNRGEKQAFFLSPMKSAYAAGLLPANHTDYAVAPLDHMMVMWTAVNRVSRSGAVIGPDERATPMQALKAITINGARRWSQWRSRTSRLSRPSRKGRRSTSSSERAA